MKCKNKFSKIYFICLILFFIGCSSPNKVSKKIVLSSDEQEWIESFFNDLLLEESGIFTLWGSKPLVFFEIDYPDEKEQEKFQTWLKSLSEKDKKEVILSIEEKDKNESWFKELPKETQENAIIRAPKKFPFYVCWEKWKKIKHRFLMSKYLLVEKRGRVHPNKRYLFFVNIAHAFFAIQENYERFARKIGKEFDPLSVIYELEHETSIFWEKALQDPELVGLLCGFGKKNAWCFSLEVGDFPSQYKSFLKTLVNTRPKQSLCRKKSTINNFSLPGFRSFVENDEMIMRYEKEKKTIKKAYKHKNFVYHSLLKLTED